MRGVKVLRRGEALPGSGGPPPGLPRALPPGETLLWQGAPSWRGLFRRAMHGRKLALYFAALGVWCAVEAVRLHSPRLWYSLVALLVLGAIALSLVALFALLVVRTTVYTVTDRRVVLTIGVALSASINLPFAAIEGASARIYRDGTGDIPLRLAGPTRIGVFQLWPHARPWRMQAVEPMLRAIPDAARVARMLAAGLAESAGQAAPSPLVSEPLPARRPGSVGAGYGARAA